MREKSGRTENLICCFLIGVFLLFYTVAMHDVQKAQGVGLYLSMQAGAENRTGFDILADAVALSVIVLLSAVPCVVLKRKSAVSFLRILLAFVAFMPQLRLSWLVHFTEVVQTIELCPALREGGFQTTFLAGTEIFVKPLQMAVPAVLLMTAELSREDMETIGKQRHHVMATICILAGVLVFLFPALSELLRFVMSYMLLLIAFDRWEILLDRYSSVPGRILFCGIGLRGIYLLIVEMSMF